MVGPVLRPMNQDMRRHSWLIVPVLTLASTARGQDPVTPPPEPHPAPAGETAAPRTGTTIVPTARERIAASTLRVVWSAQRQCQESAVIDADRDGVGEFAFFGELAGAVPVRSSGKRRPLRITPPILARSFGRVHESVVIRQGYCYALYLPGEGGEPVGEAARGGVGKPAPDAGEAAERWCCYAWPEQNSIEERLVFFIDQDANLLVSDNTASEYSGTERRPDPLAAFPNGATTMAEVPDSTRPANDRQRWNEYESVVAGDGDSAGGPDKGAPGRSGGHGPANRPGSRSTGRTRDPGGAARGGVVSILRQIGLAQARCQASGVIDADDDGAGEYGYFGELAGAVALRSADGGGARARMRPPVLTRAFGKLDRSVLVLSGYCFAIFLPDAEGRPLAEAPDGGVGEAAPDARNAERMWCCYAWPLEFGKTGIRAFFTDQYGDVYVTSNQEQRYSGFEREPDPLAAFPRGSRAMGDSPKRATPSNDGALWEHQAFRRSR